MLKIVYTDNFSEYMRSLKDITLHTLILKRLERVSLGNFGDTKLLSQGIYELRIHYGSGHRIYYTKKGNEFVILLCAGDKSSQKENIKLAQKIAKEV